MIRLEALLPRTGELWPGLLRLTSLVTRLVSLEPRSLVTGH